MVRVEVFLVYSVLASVVFIQGDVDPSNIIKNFKRSSELSNGGTSYGFHAGFGSHNIQKTNLSDDLVLMVNCSKTNNSLSSKTGCPNSRRTVRSPSSSSLVIDTKPSMLLGNNFTTVTNNNMVIVAIDTNATLLKTVLESSPV
ncbi:hypothetical protein GE061_001639 [Apolygus lucorum]|uniref:Uncharacterized protein n=1 Tax=Apolygus lucorum TaxID=248454 RepID=A0A8S9YFV2_APOLU|nr:hypothetical protein GE061_001639 [Apolygus lucorum]